LFQTTLLFVLWRCGETFVAKHVVYVEPTIADDFDHDGDILHGADPMAEYLTYLDCVPAGAVGNMGFTLEDFKRYIAELAQSRLQK